MVQFTPVFCSGHSFVSRPACLCLCGGGGPGGLFGEAAGGVVLLGWEAYRIDCNVYAWSICGSGFSGICKVMCLQMHEDRIWPVKETPEESKKVLNCALGSALPQGMWDEPLPGWLAPGFSVRLQSLLIEPLPGYQPLRRAGLLMGAWC